MKFTKSQIALLLILVASSANASFTSKQTKKTLSKIPKLQQYYLWNDGKGERKVWLSTNLVAEFRSGKEKSVKSSVKSADKDAILYKKSTGTIQIWKLSTQENASAVVKELSKTNKAEKFSTIFHDGPSNASPMRALPGNVIVYLDPKWDYATVKSFFGKRKLEILQKLEIGPNIYVVKTGPGLDALEIANSLAQSGNVIKALPNWWQETSTR